MLTMAKKQFFPVGEVDPDDFDEPMVRLGDYWLPAHLAWKKMETASVVADVIDHYNTHFPQLASEITLATVPLVRQRLRDVQVRLAKQPEKPDFGAISANLLKTHTPEDALKEILQKYQQELTLRDLIALAGEESYLNALKREALDYQSNQIMPEQTAQIWNEAQRPPPGGGLWNKQKIEQLLEQGNLG